MENQETSTTKDGAQTGLSVLAGSDFLGYDEPLGTTVKLYPVLDARTRLASYFLKREMFAYFENIANGQTGWGICFNGWLEIRGWKLVGFLTYERVQSIEEEINPNIPR